MRASTRYQESQRTNMTHDPIELLLSSHLVGSLLVYLVMCFLLFMVYFWKKNLEQFVARIFIVSAVWAAGISLTPALGDVRWFVVIFQISLAIYLIIYSRRLHRDKLKKKNP